MSSTIANVSSLEAHLGFWLRFVSNHVTARFDSLLAERAISVTEWVALRTLYQSPDVTHAVLIERLGMTKGAASKIISRLESKGLAERGVSAQSARAQTLRLTARGTRLVPELAALADANDAHFFGHLPAAKRKLLMAELQDLVDRHDLSLVPTE